MRSSIACVRCRWSKIKCVNEGIESICRSCAHASRECTYPIPIETPARRSDGVSKERKRGDGERKHRSRKAANSSPAAGPRSQTTKGGEKASLDPLDPRILTPGVWQELFDIFQAHYSADLPFLHSPTFLKPLRHATIIPPGAPVTTGVLATAESNVQTVRPPGSPSFLLAFLALTARFHPGLTAYHNPSPDPNVVDVLAASEYYASATHDHFTNAWLMSSFTDLEQIQALLMVGLHEWGMCRGAKAWVLVGMAIRAAQAMGLQYEAELDDQPLSHSMALRKGVETSKDQPLGKSTTTDATDGDDFMRQEIRRRTFWSCYIMDRYLSSGKYRPSMLHADELRIQLPASDRAFLFGERVRTLLLNESNSRTARVQETHQRRALPTPRQGVDDQTSRNERAYMNLPEAKQDLRRLRLESGADEGLVSCYVRLLEIYGKIVKWSCAGGRRYVRTK